jgi:FecR-like protein
MKTILETFTARRSVACVSIFVFMCLTAVVPASKAVQLKEARVTQIVKDVKLMGAQGGQRSAAVSDDVREGTAVRTGSDSRAELTFTDLTITRLGANTIFSFNAGARELDLAGGAVLVEVPRNGAGVKIITSAVTAAITGGTALFEYHKRMPAKLLVLEGHGRFCSVAHPDECVTVGPGEMAMMTADGHISQPTEFNAKLVFSTSKLIVGFPPLPNEDLILEVINDQQAAQSEGTSNSSSNDSADAIDKIVTSTAALGGSGAKFGPPSAITAPNPYVINSGTQINTDPTITTNGVTNLGKIYRGAAQDGSLAIWLGSSPTAFDSVDFFDSTNSGGGFNPDSKHLPIPGFLFGALRLDGDPTVSNSSGYPTLGLVSQGDINSSASGAVFTFGGMPEVALVSLNGSINLSGISFMNFGQLTIIARGEPNGSVTLAAPISNLAKVQLRAPGDVQVNAAVTVSDQFKALAGNNLVVASPVNANRITLQSLGGIFLTNSSQLVSMLNSVGNSGQIVIIASGSDTPANISGSIQTDGELDIRSTGVAGQTTLNNATIHGDVVKVSALGTNGVLNIGSGNSINADTVIKLYASGSNGTLNFLSSVTLTSPSNILAANTINISQGAVVTINNPGTPADVFTNNPNYFGFGGNAPSPATAGTFGGVGAKNPQPLGNAPALGPPGGGP